MTRFAIPFIEPRQRNSAEVDWVLLRRDLEEIETAIDGTLHDHDGEGAGTVVVGGQAEGDPGKPVATTPTSVVIGDYASASGVLGGYNVAIGSGAFEGDGAQTGANTTGFSVVIGGRAQGLHGQAVVVGGAAESFGSQSVTVGASAAGGQATIAIGFQATAWQATETVAIGHLVSTASVGSTILGYNASTLGRWTTALGYRVQANADYAIAIGGAWGTSLTVASGLRAIAIGYQAQSSGQEGVALGPKSQSTHSWSVAIGSLAQTTASNQIMLGTSTHQVYVPGTFRIPTGGGTNKILASDANGVGSWADPGTVEGVGDLNYTHDQIAPQTTWTITHNLGKYPSVAVADSAGTWVVGDVQYVSANEVVLTFAGAFSGKAYLN